MSTVNSFTSGTTISSSDMNANFSDVAAEITGSLPRDGQAAMTGQLKAATGSAAAPSVTFSVDPDTGVYRKASDSIGFSVGGAEVASMTSTGVKDSAGNAMTAFPSGTAMLFVQTSAPTGWTKSTTHNDKALRVVSGTASTGGSTAFTSVFTSRTIAEANLPAHTHSAGTLAAASNGAHTHSYDKPNGFGANTGGGASITSINGFTSTLTDSQGAHTHTISGSTASTGSGTAMDFAVQYVDVIIATKD